MRHLDITQGRYKHLTLLRAKMLKATRKWFEDNKYLEVPCPAITGATGSCEWFPNAMSVDMFNVDGSTKEMYLRQTAQLYLEAFTQVHDKVYTIGPSFRQEKKVTDRHLCEFNLIELEGLNLGLGDLMNEIESIIKAMYKAAMVYGDKNTLQKYIDLDFARITYKNALTLLNNNGYQIDYGKDLKDEHEKFLCFYYERPVFVTLFPPSLHPDNPEEVIKFFSMKRNLKNGYTLCADLLLPGVGESVGSAVREGDPKVCKEQLLESIMYQHMLSAGVSEKEFNWYFEVLAQTPPEDNSAGCGIGFERVVQSVLATLTEGETSIKNSIEIPRSPDYLLV